MLDSLRQNLPISEVTWVIRCDVQQKFACIALRPFDLKLFKCLDLYGPTA